MSFLRLIYLSSIIGGWSAFIGWLFTEIAFGRYLDRDSVHPLVRAFLAVLMATLVAVPIGGGISVASSLGNLQIFVLLKRLAIGFVGGLVGGLLGSLLGMCIFGLVETVTFLALIGRVLGWTLIGVGIGAGMGVSEGLFDRSMKKARNGLIGGGLGGFLGGLFFVPISWIIASNMSGRAFAFVTLGLSIGLFIGLAQIILKEAWLTVEQGFRPGRQMVLTQDVITMGTSEKSSLIFIAYGAKGVEPIHLRIVKQPDGRYLLEDNQSRTGTLLNGLSIAGPTVLRDGDAIQLGVNLVRFNERAKQGATNQRLPSPAAAPAMMQTPMPVPASTAIQSAPAPMKPAPAPVAIQSAPKPAAPPAAVKPAPRPAPAPAPAPVKPAAVEKPQEGRCPICDKKVVGIPGNRRCSSCFATF